MSPASADGCASRERRPDRDRALLDGGQDRAPPRFLQLLELDARRLGAAAGSRASASGVAAPCASGSAARGRGRPCSSRSSRKASDSRERSDAGPGHLHERELERQARVAALAHVVDRDCEQVDQPDHGRRRQLVRLLAQPLARLVGHGQRVRHLAHVLDEQQVAQVLEQVGDEPAEVLALLGQLLEEAERAGGVASTTRSQSRKSTSSSTAPSSCSTSCTVIGRRSRTASWSSVETASR